MARRPTKSGFAPVSLHVITGKGASRGGGAGGDGNGGGEDVEEKTSIDPGPPRNTDDGWDEAGTSVDDGGSIDTTGRGELASSVDEPTVEDQARPLPPLSLVPPLPKPAPPPAPPPATAPPRLTAQAAKLVVIAGNDTGRDFPLDASRPLTVGRAIDNDIVLTDIAVSRKHLDLSFDGEFWVLKDRGSGNGSLVNDRIEDGSCRLQQGDRIEIGNTVFRFEHPGAVASLPALGWGQNDEDEASTVAGRSSRLAMPDKPLPEALVTAPLAKPRTTMPGVPAAPERKAPLPAPTVQARNRPPHSTQPPLPGGDPMALPGALPSLGGEPRVMVRPSSVMEQAIPESMLSSRHLTTTARVEPRTFHPAAAAYPFVVGGPRRSRPIAIGAAVMAAILGVGVIAKLTTKDGATRAATAAKQTEPRAIVVPVPTPIVEPTPIAPAPAPPPIPAPTPTPAPATRPETPAPRAVAPVAPKITAPAPTPAPAPMPKSAAVAPPTARAPVPMPAPAPVATAKTPAPTKPPAPAAKTPAPAPKTIAAVTPVRTPTPAPRTETPKPRPQPAKVTTSTAKSDTTRTETAHPRAQTSASEPASSKATAKALLAARKRAAQQYADGEFHDAATTLRDAADDASDDAGVPLRSLASEYEAVGEAMSQGAAAASRPVEAFAAYSRALQSDRRAGGAQGAEIREKLGEFAPKAAASYMAKSNFEAAKRAADSAADFGEGSSPLVQQVRSSLEKKAAEFLATAQKMMASQPEDAKGLLRRIMKMVAPDSPTYQRAYAQLNARPRPRDDDE